MTQSVFVTGAGGFIGRALVSRLVASADRKVKCLTRQAAPESAAGNGKVQAVIGDLLDDSRYKSALAGADVVVHLAAATGRAAPAEYSRVNVEGTRTLVRACKDAGVRRLLYVSTIAAGYPDQRYYPYARTKAEAEAIVRQSGLAFTIVRPTIVLGGRSPIWKTLSGIARLPLIPLPQGRRPVAVQPVHVDDVVRGIELILDADRFAGETFDLGGPAAMPFSGFLTSIRQAMRGAAPKIIAIPLAPIRFLLALAEPLFRQVMPVTAGQLAVFANDSTASPGWLHERLLPGMLPVERTLARLASEAGAMPAAGRSGAGQGLPPDSRILSPSDQLVLDDECVRFSAYLIDFAPTDYVKTQYRQAARARRLAFDEDFPAFDRALLTLARKHGLLTRCADAYCAIFRRAGTLRCKLIVLSAILEHVAPASEAFDGTAVGGAPRAVAALFVAGMTFALSLIAGVLMAVPLWACCVLAAAIKGPADRTRSAR